MKFSGFTSCKETVKNLTSKTLASTQRDRVKNSTLQVETKCTVEKQTSPTLDHFFMRRKAVRHNTYAAGVILDNSSVDVGTIRLNNKVRNFTTFLMARQMERKREREREREREIE